MTSSVLNEIKSSLVTPDVIGSVGPEEAVALVATMHGVNGWLLSFAGGNAVSEPAAIESAITGSCAGRASLIYDQTALSAGSKRG